MHVNIYTYMQITYTYIYTDGRICQVIVLYMNTYVCTFTYIFTYTFYIDICTYIFTYTFYIDTYINVKCVREYIYKCKLCV